MVYTDPSIRVQVEVDPTKLAGFAHRIATVVQAINNVVKATFRDAFADIFSDLMEDVGDPSGGAGIVPCATGQLRQNVLDNLGSSRVWDTGLQLTIGSNISYAQYTNQMPQSSLAHFGGYRYVNYYGYSYKYGGAKRKGVHHKPGELAIVGTPVQLNDPGAQHNWMQFLVLHSRTWLKQYLNQYLQQHATAAGLQLTARQAGITVTT